ncbi:gp16 family protein [Rhizobium hidalgonense]|uniref:GemA protein n=1 Tax=Rhizobium hidalgonense TaxID=1538159 RepID=A0ABX4JG60_9HYPH|nr:hypothetical protein CO674_35420 [Rhizobium hidalgonense]
MTSLIAAIHVAKKQLGLDDDTYRAKLARITGKQSARDMTEEERQKVLTVFRNDGFAAAPAARRGDGRQKLTGKYAKKLQALWIAAWNLGIARDRDDKALTSFVKRQTGLDHTRFLIYPDDANRAIESLKGSINREAGVPYGNTNGYDWLSTDGAKVAWAQWKILTPGAGLIVRRGFDEEVSRLTGTTTLSEVTPQRLAERDEPFRSTSSQEVSGQWYPQHQALVRSSCSMGSWSTGRGATSSRKSSHTILASLIMGFSCLNQLPLSLRFCHGCGLSFLGTGRLPVNLAPLKSQLSKAFFMRNPLAIVLISQEDRVQSTKFR